MKRVPRPSALAAAEVAVAAIAESVAAAAAVAAGGATVISNVSQNFSRHCAAIAQRWRSLLTRSQRLRVCRASCLQRDANMRSVASQCFPAMIER